MTVLGYSCRKRSSQATDSASRWFVGSSSKSMSGCDINNRHSATRRRSPPDRVLTSASHGGRRNASAAISSLRSSSHAPAVSILSCNLPCSSSNAFISSSPMGSANCMEISLKRLIRALDSAMPSSTLPRTSLAGSSSGSCGKKPILMPGWARASPSKSVSIPAMIRNTVDLPDPFRPRTPIFAPGKNDSEISRMMKRFGGTILATRFMV